jgi:hypothetical protein
VADEGLVDSGLNDELWSRVAETIRGAGDLVLGASVPSSPRDRAEGYRYLTRLLAAGIVTCVAQADPDQPRFARMVDYDMRWGLDCPDCLYLYAAVRADAAYRIYGSRGSANHIDIQVNYGHFASGDISEWGTISSCNGFDLDIAPDGTFELLLSSEPQPGAWLRLDDNAEFVLVRQYFNDWDHERPADLFIERVGGARERPPAPGDIAGRLDRLCYWLQRGGRLWEKMSRDALGLAPNSLNVFLPRDSDQRAGLAGQAYGIGNFQCGSGEAVIVEFQPPRCHHWSVSLANYYWESLDFATRQTSLNGHQATIDHDGLFRAVIAHEDPRVANWLDTTGHQRGTITARFLLADDAPTPQLRVVPVSRLRDELPPETAGVDPPSREASLNARRRAVFRRYRQ